MADQKWKRWGAELRHHRQALGMSQAALAKAIHIAGPTISTFERGTRTPRREHAMSADEALDTGGLLVQLWEELHDEREIPEDWRDFEKVERQAVEIREYHPAIFPGLLQTPDYIRALMTNPGVWDDGWIERMVRSRSSRLDNIGPTRLTFVLDEVVLRRTLGSTEVLRGQLEAVLRLVDQGRVRVLVIPDRCPLHPSPSCSFRIITLGDGRMVAHEEYWTGINVTTGPTVNQFVTLFGNLQVEALNLPTSVELIRTIKEGL